MLMLSLLILFVLILIVSQISYSARTNARVARNEDVLIAMDLSIESILLETYEDLKADAEADAAMGDGGDGDMGASLGGGFGGGGGGGGSGDEAAGGSEAPTDSREDDWAEPKRKPDFNELNLRVLIQDEDSKFNVLSILTEDEDEADKAFERLVRVIEFSRKGTEAEIDAGQARRMATAILEFMNRRRDQYLPQPVLLSDDEENDDIGLPFSLRELVAIDPELFTEDQFRDFRDDNDRIVHSLESFLTVYSSLSSGPSSSGPAGGPTTRDEEPEEEGDPLGEGGEGDPDVDPDTAGDLSTAFGGEGEGGDTGLSGGGDGQGTGSGGGGDRSGPSAGGGAGQGSTAEPDGRVNLNTAPAAVLAALLEQRDLPYRFWDDVLEFRNEPVDEEEEADDPPLDEYGEEIVAKKIFNTAGDLSQIDGWFELEPIFQGELLNLLKTRSSVFTIYVTARKPTGEERFRPDNRKEDIERAEAEGQGLVRTVKSVVWRRALPDGSVEIVPLVRWAVVDYVPYEVQDFPDEER